MRLIRTQLQRTRALQREGSETGAVLVAVVVVMLLGFLVAVTIAASVVFTIGANAANRSNTQAFIAAESGRDAAIQYLSGTCGVGSFPSSPSAPEYTTTISVTTGAEPKGPSDTGVSVGCPDEHTTYVVISATGTGADGSTSTVNAVYPWIVSWEEQAGGVLAYFAGGVTSTVSNYTGDLVVRSGNYTCNNEGTINGDLYVTRGSVILSRACTVNGDIWVRDNVDASSQLVNVTGIVKAGGNVTFTSNGTELGTDAGGGDVEAGGDIDLTDTGASTGTAHGNLTASGEVNVGNKWVLDAGVDQTEGAVAPVFTPTLDFIRSITSWIDLDEASGWVASETISACSLSPAQIVAEISDGGTDPVIFDFRNCAPVQTDIMLSGPAPSVTVTKDVLFLAPQGKRMNLNIQTGLSGGKQLVFLHSDASRDLSGGETSPDCGSGQKDSFNIQNGSSVSGVKLMVYSPCGLTGNINEDFSGQLYSNDTSGVKFNYGATYTCSLMSWPDAFEKLGCKVRGEGEDVVLETVLVQRLGDRLYQTEVTP